MLNRALIVAFCLLLALPAHANPVVQKHLPNAQQIGEGRFSFAFWDVYDATLYAPNGSFDFNKPHALSLHYLRNLDGVDIAERSIVEMKKQGFTDTKLLKDWHKQMVAIFPDVHKGTELTALFIPNNYTEFFHNGKSIAVVKDALFTTQFASIWLSEKTSEPAFRKKLLGQK